MAKYPRHPRSRASAFAIYGVAVALSVIGLAVLAERFHWVMTHPAPMNYTDLLPRPTAGPSTAPAKTIPPSPQVIAFVGHLKTIPGLETLWDQAPCGGSGKQPQRPRYCTYRTGDVAVMGDVDVRVGYDRADGELRSVSFTRRYLNDTLPLPWSHFASLIPWVCREVSAAQAIATAAEGAEAYAVGPWASHVGRTFERNNVEVASREIRLEPYPQCKVALVEQISTSRNDSELYVLFIKPRPERRPKLGGLT